MDYTAKMKYGTDEVEIEVKGAKTVEVLNPDPMPEIEDVAEAFIILSDQFSNLQIFLFLLRHRSMEPLVIGCM